MGHYTNTLVVVMDDRADKPKHYEIAMSSQLQKLVSILKGHNFQVNLEL